jgi:hypothetical protein
MCRLLKTVNSICSFALLGNKLSNSPFIIFVSSQVIGKLSKNSISAICRRYTDGDQARELHVISLLASTNSPSRCLEFPNRIGQPKIDFTPCHETFGYENLDSDELGKSFLRKISSICIRNCSVIPPCEESFIRCCCSLRNEQQRSLYNERLILSRS